MKKKKKTTPAKPSGYSNFDSLAKKLLGVPKHELDREAAKYEKKKQRKNNTDG